MTLLLIAFGGGFAALGFGGIVEQFKPLDANSSPRLSLLESLCLAVLGIGLLVLAVATR